MSKTLRHIKRQTIEGLRKKILQVNGLAGNYKTDPVWLIGSGRSGTTWVSNMINHNLKYREMIEPFRPLLIEDVRFLGLHEYERPDQYNPELNAVAKRIFGGDFYHEKVDSASKRLSYNGLLIKDVFANLLAYNTYQNFQNIKPILLLRNPFLVAHSKHSKRDWNWMTDPSEFLKQEKLMNDFLEPFRALINEVSNSGDFIEKQILVWCIINYVPLKQFSSKELLVISYEEMIANLQQELKRIYHFIGQGELSTAIPKSIVNTASSVSIGRDSAPTSIHWTSKFTSTQLNTGYHILKAFGFDHLYTKTLTYLIDQRLLLSGFNFLNPLPFLCFMIVLFDQP